MHREAFLLPLFLFLYSMLVVFLTVSVAAW